MSKYNKPILVTWDFSKKAEEALLHALNYSNFTNTDVVLLNIVKKDKEVDKAIKKLEVKIEEIKSEHGKTVHAIVKVGTIFNTITDVIKETDAILAIMGTHGMKGFQKVTGSWALKVITGSASPFIVIQAPPKKHDLKDIVVPLDFRTENKEKLIWTNYLNKLFHAKFHLCYTDTSDKLARKRLLANIKTAVEYMHSREINYEIKKLDKKGGLGVQTLDFAKEIDAALILILTTKNLRSVDLIVGADEQKIIANDFKIPVMCVNPRTDTKKLGTFN